MVRARALHRARRCQQQPSEPLQPTSYRNCPKRATRNAPSVNMAGIRRPKWTEQLRFGVLQGNAASASEAFRTVSKGEFSEVRCPLARYVSKPARLASESSDYI